MSSDTILGISFETHHHGAAIIKSGTIVSAVTEDSLSRIKADNSVPLKSISQCLKMSNLTPQQIDIVAIAGLPPLQNLYYAGNQIRREMLAAGYSGLTTLIYHSGNRLVIESGFMTFIKKLALCTGLPQFIAHFYLRLRRVLKELRGFKGRIVYVDHHIAHLYLPLYLSGYSDCLSIVVEGLDKRNSLSIDGIQGNHIIPLDYLPWPQSPGYYYRLVTLMLGLCPQTDGGKVMGMAAYGKPDMRAQQAADLLGVIDGRLWCSPKIHKYRHQYAKSGELPERFQNIRPEDLAWAFQNKMEKAIPELVASVSARHGFSRVVLSGGSAANVKVNEKILNQTGIRELFVSPAMGDSGLPLGAALFSASESGALKPADTDENIFWGPSYGDDEILNETGSMDVWKASDLTDWITELLKDGWIVARFSGAMEYSPRALGNRSILCRPDRPDLAQRLFRDLHRPEYMPFAPSVLASKVDTCFLDYRGGEKTARFMNISFQATSWFRECCSTVVHVDGSSRPSLVDNSNPSMKKILDVFFQKTGLPALLNTSFNNHGEPTVCSPRDAIKTFKSTSIDYLAIGPFMLANSDRRVDLFKNTGEPAQMLL